MFLAAELMQLCTKYEQDCWYSHVHSTIEWNAEHKSVITVFSNTWQKHILFFSIQTWIHHSCRNI